MLLHFMHVRRLAAAQAGERAQAAARAAHDARRDEASGSGNTRRAQPVRTAQGPLPPYRHRMLGHGLHVQPAYLPRFCAHPLPHCQAQLKANYCVHALDAAGPRRSWP